MIDLIDLAKVRAQSTDLDDLQLVLKQLIGQPFLSFRISYGDELRIHLGEGRPLDHPRLKGMVSGSHVIGTRASSWSVRSEPQAVLLTCDAGDPDGEETKVPSERSRDIHIIEAGTYIAPGTILRLATAINVKGGYGLWLKFTDDSEIFVIPPPPGPPTPEDIEWPVADWEVITPNERLLVVGPGRSWSYPDSR